MLRTKLNKNVFFAVAAFVVCALHSNLSLANKIVTAEIGSMNVLYYLGNDNFSSFNANAVGQTFQSEGQGFEINSFSFYLTPDQTSSISLHASVYAWNGSGLLGTALYSSQVITVDWSNLDNFGFEKVTFSPNALNLVGGASYIALLEADSATDNAGWGMAWDSAASGGNGNFTDAYAGGQMVVRLAGSNSWIGYQAFQGSTDAPDSIDTAFELNYTTIDPPLPEPASLALVFGALVAGSVTRRRKS